ncbi:MAG: hypothetical protein JSV21_09010 [Nitrospirota bacterium]|nr:MAG: hypothetical protein JSV21_09010 [Nitrospirota bacterium]
MKLFALKRELKKKLAEDDMDAIAGLASEDRRVINILMSFSYDKDTELSWRAVQAVGESARVLINSDYDFIRDTTRRLIWSVTEESGNVAWSSIEMLSEIIASDLSRLYDLVPIVVSMYEEEIFREGVMYGLSKFAESSPDIVLMHAGTIREALSDVNPRVRYFALMSAKRAGMEIPDDIRERLSSDHAKARIYIDGMLRDVEVRDFLTE